MIIRNLNKKYMVIQENLGVEDVRQYICYDMDSAQNTQYCAVCQNLTSVRPDEIRFLMEQLNNENFSDLVDFFINDDFLCILIKYHAGIWLENKISSEKCSLNERLELVKNLLERVLILNMPDYFFYSAMNINRIKVTKANEVYFTYDCCDIAQFDSINFQDGLKSLADVIEFIFEQEIKQRSIQELFALVYDLRHDGIKSYLGIYERYWDIYQIYFGKKQEDLKPYSLAFRIWEIIKKIGVFLKKFVKIALVLLAIAYLVVSIMELYAEPGFNENFKSIGTVEIKKNNPDKEITNEDTTEENKENEDVSGVE